MAEVEIFYEPPLFVHLVIHKDRAVCEFPDSGRIPARTDTS